MKEKLYTESEIMAAFLRWELDLVGVEPERDADTAEERAKRATAVLLRHLDAIVNFGLCERDLERDADWDALRRTLYDEVDALRRTLDDEVDALRRTLYDEVDALRRTLCDEEDA